MGTNYFIVRNFCEHCGRGEREHIGKSSAGWTFSFQATDEVYDFATWLENVKRPGSIIVDEYDGIFTVDELLTLIERKRDAPNNHARDVHELPGHAFLDKDGNSFTRWDFS